MDGLPLLPPVSRKRPKCRVPVRGSASEESNLAKYVLTDSRAILFLVQQEGCCIVEPEVELEGYEVYIVEQWACDRKLNASIVSYTGNPDHKIKGTVLGLPKDNTKWTETTKELLDEFFKLHLRPKETGHGLLYVSNLSSFPSNLNLIPVPTGNLIEAIPLFDVNENLRRTGCGGRLAMSVGMPPDSCSDKFKQLFKTHDKVPIVFAVRELVTLVQISLFYCNMLEAKYVDGLLCNHTVRGLSSWWDEMGKMRFGTVPKDGILGPTTVAAIIGFVMGMRSRLAASGLKPPKDPFSVEEFLNCIKQFQKHERLPRSVRLDSETVNRLYTLTEKTVNPDLFGIVKSVKEVSGKQVQHNVADAETLDLDRLISFLQGYRAKYLWLGKGRMRANGQMCGDGVAMLFCGQSVASRTGIPFSSLDGLEPTTSGARDIRAAMMKSVNYRKKDVIPSSPSVSVTTSRTYVAQPSVRSGTVPDGSSIASSHTYRVDTFSKRQQQGRIGRAYDGYEVDDLDNSFAKSSEDWSQSRFKLHSRFRKYLTATTGRPLESSSEDEDGVHRQRNAVSSENSEDEGRRERNHSTRSHSSRFSRGLAEVASTAVTTRPISSLPQGTLDSSDSQLLVGKVGKGSAGGLMTTAGMCMTAMDICCKQSHDDCFDLCLRRDQKQVEQYQLRRTRSFSTAEDVVLRWTCDQAESRITRTYMKALRTRQKLVHEVSVLGDISQAYEDKVKTMGMFLKKDKELVKGLNHRLKGVSDKEIGLKNLVNEVEAMTARLQYEARMVDVKLHDVEDSVEAFASKVEGLEARLDRIDQCRSAFDESCAFGESYIGKWLGWLPVFLRSQTR